jgi:hypothetical protein
MKCYFRAVVALVFALLTIGVVLPYLISAKSDELYWFGVTWGVVSIPVFFKLVMWSVK